MTNYIKTSIINNNIGVTWINDENANKYIIQGYTNTFCYETLYSCINNFIFFDKTISEKYIGYRILCVDKKNVIHKIIYSDTIDDVTIKFNNKCKNENISLKFVKSYGGSAVSFVSDIIYDLYVLYEVVDDEKNVIAMTNDFHITSSIIEKGKKYYCEAFKRNNDKYEIECCSEITTCVYKNFKLIRNQLTICIPVYNGQNFIERTIDSVLLSSIDNFKIIICNDGSTDDTSTICKWYGKNYPFVKFIDKKNSGVSDTRNKLLDNVKTKYMAFLDADDIVHPYMYEKLYNRIIEQDADVSISKVYIREEDNTTNKVLDINKEDRYVLYSFDKMFEEYNANSFNNIFFVAVWNKIVKTEIAKKVCFPTIDLYEDSAYTFSMYTYADKFVFDCDAFYVWDKRKRKTVGTYSTAYNKIAFKDIIETFYESTSYPWYKGLKERKNYIEYYVIKELCNYYKSIKTSTDEHSIEYKKKTKELINSANIDGNELFINNKELYDLINNFEI